MRHLSANEQRNCWLLAGVLLLLAAITALHYLTSVHLVPYHVVYRSLYFLPIAMAAVLWGVRGGLITALLVTALHLPYMLFISHETSDSLLDNILELILFYGVALLAGILSARQQQQRREALRMRTYIDGILASLPIGVATIEPTGKIALQNPAAVHLIGKEVHDFPYPIQQGYSECQWQGRALGIHRSTLSSALGDVITIEDLSEQRRLAEKIRQAERQASLGRLAGGLAHEIRNPLGILRATAQLLATRLQNIPEVTRYTQVVTTESDRIDRLISEILSYAHPRSLSLEAVAPGPFLEQLLQDCQPYAEQHSILLEIERRDNLPIISADTELLRQALLNLLLNAIQASSPGQTVTLSAQQADTALCFAICDRGPGISDTIKGRIFDPFFTTRDEGTGMGLAVVARIVSDHQGSIELEERPEGGTRARLCLPLQKEQP